MIPKRPKLSNSNLYFKSNWSRKSTPKFGLKINSRWLNVKLRGQMIIEFDDFTIHGKLMKQGIQWNKNQVIWIWDQRDILVWNWQKFVTKIWQKYEFNYFYTSNPIEEMIWLQFTRIEEYSPVSSLMYDQRSRGDYDHFLAINSWLSCFNGCRIWL